MGFHCRKVLIVLSYYLWMLFSGYSCFVGREYYFMISVMIIESFLHGFLIVRKYWLYYFMFFLDFILGIHLHFREEILCHHFSDDYLVLSAWVFNCRRVLNVLFYVFLDFIFRIQLLRREGILFYDFSDDNLVLSAWVFIVGKY